jgi:hypothetical protein
VKSRQRFHHGPPKPQPPLRPCRRRQVVRRTGAALSGASLTLRHGCNICESRMARRQFCIPRAANIDEPHAV